jgi:PAS domain S-box-containing protein
MPNEPLGTILIVEDDPGVALLHRRRLERSGFQTETVGDVDSALAALARDSFDLIVMDYRLGSATGLDLHRRIKASGFNVPVIIVSGLMDDRLTIEAMRAGIRDVIVKSTDYLDYLPDAARAVLRQTAAASDRVTRGRAAGALLIVEDDEGAATLQRRQLERAGYTVEVAADAAAALEVVRRTEISLALIDWKLPDDSSGIDLYEQLNAGGRNVPAILVTAFPDQTAAIRAMRAGMRDFVPKSEGYLDYLPAAVDRVIAQVRVERKLLESELRLASIVGTAMDAMLMCDADRRIVLFNRAAEEMFGAPASLALTRTLDAFIPELQLEASRGEGLEVPAPGTLRQRAEVHAVRAGGERVPIEVSVSDVLVDDRLLFTVIARDISERKRIEAELRDADRRKDEFLGMLAHELRNPLAAIMGAGAVLKQSATDPRTEKLTTVVTRQSQALARMVDDLLDVSRVTLGKIRIAAEPLVLNQVVTRAADHMRAGLTAQTIAFDVSIDPDPIWVNGDATRLEQVLMNLLTNAAKFTPPGGRISLRAWREDGEAVVRVQDTGVGIEPSLIPKVFDLFVQGDTSLARTKSGLGIGLALVRQVVALHDGRVSAHSAGHGKGSEFVVRLPLAADDAAPLAEADAARAVPVRPMRLLVVDDQHDVADALALLLESFGHEVYTAYESTGALRAARAHSPEVMFVDIGMPGLTGYELARQVRSDRRLSHVQLVALTGYGRDEDRARALDAGFDLHLTKPVHESTLHEVLEALSTAHPSERRDQ